MARVIEITSWFQSVTDLRGPLGSFLYLRIYYLPFEDILQSNTTWCFLLIGSSVLWSTLAPPHHRTEYINDPWLICRDASAEGTGRKGTFDLHKTLCCQLNQT